MNYFGGYDEFPFVAEFYDHVVPYRERPDVAFYVEMARQFRAPVLELGCGTGRILIPTARAGIDIVGIDSSSSMLSLCHEKLSRESDEVRSRVRLLQVDMREFEFQEEFSLITIPFRGFQHLLTVDEQFSCLRSVHRHLSPTGRFVFDVFNPALERLVDEKYLKETDEEPEFTMPDGRKVVRKYRGISRDLFSQIIDGELTYYVSHPNGSKERLAHRFQMRYFFRFELEHLLARSGFEIESLYGDFDRSPVGTKYPGELILVARRE